MTQTCTLELISAPVTAKIGDDDPDSINYQLDLMCDFLTMVQESQPATPIMGVLLWTG